MTQRILNLYNSIHACLRGESNACDNCIFNTSDEFHDCSMLLMEELADTFEELEEKVETLSSALAASGEVATVTTEPSRATTDDGAIIGMVNKVKDTLLDRHHDAYSLAVETSSREESAFYLGRALAFNQAYVILDNGWRNLN